MNITTMTEIELKALAYDQISLIQTSENNLKLISQELTKRNQPEQPREENTPEPINAK